MIVGIDVDGVLIDVEKYIIEVGTKFYGPLLHPDKYFVSDKWDLSPGSDKKFWDVTRKDYVVNGELMPGLDEFGRYMTESGIPHVVITNRGDDARDQEEREFIREKTNELVYQYLPNVTKIVHNYIGTKLQACLENHVDVMIDDHVGHLEVLCEHMKCITINEPHNRSFHHPNLIRVDSLVEIPIILNIMKELP